MTCSPSFETRPYSIQAKARKYVNGYEFLSLARNLSNKYGKQLLNNAAEATSGFIGNKIAEKIMKQKLVSDENLRDVEEMIISPEKREELLNELRQVL